jgi:peptidoglycan glycosyltransferase
LHNYLPQAAYGQYPVKATPLQMSQVAATIANNGTMVPGHLFLNTQNADTLALIDPGSAAVIGAAMRGAVMSGTAMKIAPLSVPVAGKTGTAEVGPGQTSHSWFIGYAPYGGRRPLAFALFFENGGYGSKVALPAAGELVTEASRLGLFE